MSSIPRASRAAFFIFDPTLVSDRPKPSEDDEADAKIIYYCPSSASQQEKRSQAGMIEGLISFCSMFKGESGESSGPLRSIRTKQLSFSVLQAEPHIWMVLAMRHPQIGTTQNQGQAPEPCYDDDSIEDSTLQAILRNCYSVFRLLHGTIGSFKKEHSTHKLFDLLEDFIPAFLETVDAADFGIFHELDGFHYGPVERNTCISIHCYLLKMQEQFPTIRHAALLYNAHLIYTSFSLADTQVLYSYLVSFNGAVSNHKLNQPPFGRIPTAASQPGGGSSSFGRAFLLSEHSDFLLGVSRRAAGGASPASGGGGAAGPASVFVPAVYLTEGGAGQLVALTYHEIMLILIFEEGAKLDARTLESVRAACTRSSGDGLSLSELLPLIASQYAQGKEHEDEYCFVYHNSCNHALRLSNQRKSARSLLASRSAANRASLCPIRAALADPRMNCREVSWKSADRGWICAKRWRERQFYLLLDGPGMSLAKCQEECVKFASIHFSNIFMM
eukprot:TRINITY_DN13892_c0_g1_i1.p1 TRINITY_DN13892_c0_g1~~TRINITY_DN13892_c0_g1_i1.p1  ORF type:complete len:502 (-),score=67.28 TRINITY_DN13892_c0_g1_i1:119-1624(-)